MQKDMEMVGVCMYEKMLKKKSYFRKKDKKTILIIKGCKRGA